jgi:hypothetical protein
MYGSIVRKLKLEKSIEDTARMVASPKIVIQGEFETQEDIMNEAKEAASLDTHDVVILQNGKEFKIINPEQTLAELYGKDVDIINFLIHISEMFYDDIKHQYPKLNFKEFEELNK